MKQDGIDPWGSPAGSVPQQQPEACPGGCTHTDQEHRAFDRGVRDGEAGKDTFANPFKMPSLREAWRTGQSVGSFNRAGALRAREQALRVVWRRWAARWPFATFRIAFDSVDLRAEAEQPPVDGEHFPPGRELVALARLVGQLTRELEVGQLHYCAVCETIHPPVGPGQALLLPDEPSEAARVLDAHLLDELDRAGPGRINIGAVLRQLSGGSP